MKEKDLWSHRLSRRRLLRISVKVAAGMAVVSAGGGLYWVLREAKGAPSESRLLKERIEKNFNVRLVTLRGLCEKKNIPYPPSEFEYDIGTGLRYDDVPEEWDLERLRNIKSYLEVLPTHLYQSEESGKTFEIALSVRDCQCRSTFNENIPPYRVELSYPIVTSDNYEEGFLRFTHELIHVNQKQEWFDFFRKKFGEGFLQWYEMREQWWRNMKPLYKKLGSLRGPTLPEGILTPDEEEKYYFFRRASQVTMGREDASGELFPFFGENYVKGKDYFLRRFGDVYDPEALNLIYNFVKNEIFRGREYGSLPISSNPPPLL